MYLNRMFDESRDVLGRVSPEKVAEKINALGSTAKALFGKQFSDVQRALKDMATLGRNVNDRDLARLAGMPITDQLQAINGLTQQVADLKGINLLRVLEQAAADGDANRVLNAVLKPNNVSAVKAAKDILGDQSPTMEMVRDLAIRDILANAADPGDDFVEAVLKGKNSTAIETALNRYGRATLTELLGKDVVDGLYSLARFSRLASNDPIKGLGGLAPAQTVQNLGAVSFIFAPLQTVSAIAGLQIMSKLLRTKTFLDVITRPTGIRPGAGVDYDKVGRALEMVWELVGQVSAQGASQGQQAAAQRVERMQAPEGMPQVQMPQGAPQFQFAPPPRMRLAPQSNAAPVSPALLGDNPAEQAANMQIAQATGRV